jgi:hypothetical protein
MDRLRLGIFFAFFLLVISLAVNAQQLPDSLLTKHEPMMVVPDTVLPVVAVVSGDSIYGYQPISICPWPLIGGYGEGYPCPGIYTITVTQLPCCYTITYVTVDSTQLIPHADSFIGTKATTVVAKKMLNAAHASAFGNAACRFTTKVSEE